NLAGTCAAAAGTTEWRTEPLMGLRYRRLLLHDGRAGRVMDAILAHGGEAQLARDSFAALDRLTQEALLRFLGTL
ncbi:MAG: di-heme oxidoredictase family protein, partial [Gemmatimonadota bacterium]